MVMYVGGNFVYLEIGLIRQVAFGIYFAGPFYQKTNDATFLVV